MRHWLAYRRDTWGALGAPTVLTDEANVRASRAAGLVVKGPFVPADQLAGAVEALREVRRILERRRDADAAASNALGVVYKVLAAAEGQS